LKNLTQPAGPFFAGVDSDRCFNDKKGQKQFEYRLRFGKMVVWQSENGELLA
jgi:hypothetical protein